MGVVSAKSYRPPSGAVATVSTMYVPKNRLFANAAFAEGMPCPVISARFNLDRHESHVSEWTTGASKILSSTASKSYVPPFYVNFIDSL